MKRKYLPILLGVFGVVMLSCSTGDRYASFHPGAEWLDTAGNPVNAHGGGILYHDGTYYWYGEMKEGESWLPEANKSWDGYRVEVTGIACYSSRDLYNWRYEGNVLPAVPDEPEHDLHPSKVVERPKVIYNETTGKFVMWMHIDHQDYSYARAGVAVSDKPTGPFSYLRSVQPNGYDSRDQTVFVDSDGSAYHICASDWNKTIKVARLTADYTEFTGEYKVIFEEPIEAPALFKKDGKYYFIGSGVTGWDPNPAHAAVAESIWGPWKKLDNPCLGEGRNTTFQSQSTFILPVQGQPDTFIYMGDRWKKTDLQNSRYVWLPVKFTGDQFTIAWQDEWDLEYFKR